MCGCGKSAEERKAERQARGERLRMAREARQLERQQRDAERAVTARQRAA